MGSSASSSSWYCACRKRYMHRKSRALWKGELFVSISHWSKLQSFVQKPFLLRMVFNRHLKHKCLGIDKPPTCLIEHLMQPCSSGLPSITPILRENVQRIISKHFIQISVIIYFCLLKLPCSLKQKLSLWKTYTFCWGSIKTKQVRNFKQLLHKKSCTRLDQIFISPCVPSLAAAKSQCLGQGRASVWWSCPWTLPRQQQSAEGFLRQGSWACN